jgi:hypothetical protein
MSETSHMSNERRQSQRFTYKSECSPILKCQTVSYRVLNISEGGLKLEVQRASGQPLHAHANLKGLLQFSGGDQRPVVGELVWIIGQEMGIKLTEPIDQQILASEADKFQP